MSELRDMDVTEMRAIEEICTKIISIIENSKGVSEDRDDIKERMGRLRRNVSIKLAKGERWNAHEVRELRKELLMAEKRLEKETVLLEKEKQVLTASIAEEQKKRATLVYKLWKMKMQSQWPNPSNSKPDEC